MPHLTVAFHTLGCKLNQLETESIAQAFRTEGFRVVPWGESADVFVVNTCTVTSKAEQKARRIIRKALKENPSACLIATGCYVQLDPESVAEIEDSIDSSLRRGSEGMTIDRGRLLLVSGDDKSALLEIPAYLADSACSSADLPSVLAAWNAGSRRRAADGSERFRFDVADFAFHSRASLKVQDGCDNACSYCRVRLARGRSVSLSAADALLRLRQLEERGYAEAVLTGVNVSQYRDRSGGPDRCMDFPGLLRYLLAGTDRIAVRISSTEPDAVTDDFADAVSHERVRPHFHLSVQSLCDATLTRMRRRYDAAKVELAVDRLRSAKADPFLACDIIAGFPAETEEEFGSSYARLERIGFAWIHAFPFSPRPGTAAATYPGRVGERIATDRVERLLSLGRRGHGQYVARWTGREVLAVAEASPPGVRGIAAALSENYLKLAIPIASDPLRPGSAIRCLIRSSRDGSPGEDSGIADVEAELIEVLQR